MNIQGVERLVWRRGQNLNNQHNFLCSQLKIWNRQIFCTESVWIIKVLVFIFECFKLLILNSRLNVQITWAVMAHFGGNSKSKNFLNIYSFEILKYILKFTLLIQKIETFLNFFVFPFSQLSHTRFSFLCTWPATHFLNNPLQNEINIHYRDSN